MSENIDRPPVPNEKNNTVLPKAETGERRRAKIQIWGNIIQAVLAVTMGIYAYFTFQYVRETTKLRIQNATQVDQGKEQLRLTTEQNHLSVEPYLTVQILDFVNPKWEEVKTKVSEATKDKTDPTQSMEDEEEFSVLKSRIMDDGQHLIFYCIVRNLSTKVATHLGVYIYDQKRKNYLACFGKPGPLGEKSRRSFSGFTENVRTKDEIEKELAMVYGGDAKFAYPYLTDLPTYTYHDESLAFIFYRDIIGRVYCYRQIFGWGKSGYYKNKIVNFDYWVDFQR